MLLAIGRWHLLVEVFRRRIIGHVIIGSRRHHGLVVRVHTGLVSVRHLRCRGGHAVIAHVLLLLQWQHFGVESRKLAISRRFEWVMSCYRVMGHVGIVKLARPHWGCHGTAGMHGRMVSLPVVWVATTRCHSQVGVLTVIRWTCRNVEWDTMSIRLIHETEGVVASIPYQGTGHSFVHDLSWCRWRWELSEGRCRLSQTYTHMAAGILCRPF